MRVLFLTPSYPTEEEPVAGTFVREHALAAAEHADVFVLHLARGYPWGVRRVEGEPLPTWRAGFPRRPAALGLLASARAGLRAVPDHDLIHAHFFLAGAPAVLLSRKPVVVSEHWSVFLPEDPMRLSAGMRIAAWLAFRRARAVLPVSHTLEKAIDAERSVIVPNAVDTDLFHPGGEPEPGRLLAVGLFYEAKGFDLLLDALPRVLECRPDVRLDLAGDGPLRAELEQRAAGLPVTFHGRLPKPQVAELMRRAQLLVLPSRFETSAVVALEALTSGLPVVGSAVGAVPEFVADGNGALARPDELAERIVDALGRDFDREAIARSARERYGRAAVGRMLADVYASLLK